MYTFLSKNGQVLAFGLGVAITVIFLLTVSSGLTEFNALEDDQKGNSDLFNFGISAAVGLIIVAAVGMIVFGLLQILTNLRGSVKGLIGLAAIVVIFFIAYSSGNPVCGDGTEGLSAGICKYISGAISTALILGVGAFILFLIFEIVNLFK